MEKLGLLLWIIIWKGAWCLRMLRLEVPSAVILGEPAWLNCTYDLESDELYSVKWYKNNVEFYRFLPSDKPPGQKYDLKGVFVDLAKSGKGHVFLTSTTLQTEGTYRCEVSAEAPSFQTVRDEARLTVYVLPSVGPTISGIKPQYHTGNTVNVTCTAGPSKPPATLRWYINGRPAPRELEIRRKPSPSGPGRLQTSTLGLSFIAQESHFVGGSVKLRCTAVIAQVYSMSSEEIVVGDTLRNTAFHTGDGPVITGGRPKYQVGDLVDVNCTSPKSRPPSAELLWFVNDVPSQGVRYPPLRFPDGDQASVLGLQFVVAQRHFQDPHAEMRLKCTATLSKVLNTSGDRSRSEETTILLGSSQQSSGLHISEQSQAVQSRGSIEQAKFNLLSSFLLTLLLL